MNLKSLKKQSWFFDVLRTLIMFVEFFFYMNQIDQGIIRKKEKFDGFLCVIRP